MHSVDIGCAPMTKTVSFTKLIRLFGDSLMMGTFVLFLWLFVSAYLSKDFTATIHINKYGEAQVEMILLIFILFPLFMVTSIFSFKDWERSVQGPYIRPIPKQQKPSNPYYRKQGEYIVCPECLGRFFVSTHNYSNVSCPYCKTKGIYEPEHCM